MADEDDEAAFADASAILREASRAITATNAEIAAILAKFVHYLINRELTGIAVDVPMTSGNRRIKIELVD